VVFGSGWTSGLPAPGPIEEEVALALANARRELETAGTELGNVVKTFVLLTDLADYGAVRQAETEFYERHAPQLVARPPAATLMVVPSLGHGGHRVLYEAIAARGREAVTYYPEYWGGRELAYPHVPKEHAKFARSQAIGNLLIVSGCQALDHDTVRVETDDVAGQSRVVLGKVRLAVEEAGGSLADIAKTNVFVKDVAALATYRAVEQELFPGHSPPTSAFVVRELPRPEFLIEVEAFANLSADPEGAGAVFTSACTGPDAASALTALDESLQRAGSATSNLVKLTVGLLDVDDRPRLEHALRAHFRERAPNLLEAPPATTFLQLVAILPPGARFQIDAVASS
jgi:enamine deaminase RidA (YjgF/YER057c/UK114 family)